MGQPSRTTLQTSRTESADTLELPAWIPRSLVAGRDLGLDLAPVAAVLLAGVWLLVRRARRVPRRVTGKAVPWHTRLMSYVLELGGARNGKDPQWVEMDRFVELERRNQELRSFFVNFPEQVQKLNATLELAEVTEIVVRATAEMLRASKVDLFLIDAKGTGLVLVRDLYRGVEREDALGLRVPLDEAPQAWIMTQRTASSASEWPFQHRGKGDLEIRTASYSFPIEIAAPIRLGDETIGLLVASGVASLTSHHQRVLSCWSNVSGLSIHNTKRMVVAQQLADTDRMTGLYNHACFHQRLSGEFNRVVRTGAPLSVIMFDVDYFKNYNDTHGHAAGDRLLTRIASILARHAPPDALLARYGGEEFVVMLPGLDEAEAAEHATALRRIVSEQTSNGGPRHAHGPVTVSAGVAAYTPDLEVAQDLVKRADEALYVSKEQGRDRVSCASLLGQEERRRGERRRSQPSPASDDDDRPLSWTG